MVKEKTEEKKVGINEPRPARTDVDESISTYNGAKTSKYNWSQSITNVDVQVKLPEGTVAKMLKVDIKASSIKVTLKSAAASDPPIMEGQFDGKVKPEDSFWSVEEKKYLNLNLEKAGEAIWKTVLKGDEEIDTTKVDNSKRIDEFDTEH